MESILKHHSHHDDTPIGLPTPVPGHPVPQVEGITSLGHNVLWTTFAIMTISTLIFAVHSYRVPTARSIFHRITLLITSCAAISYYFMAIGAGQSKVHVGRGLFREVYWARDVDWLITTPLLLLDMSLLAGLPLIDMVSIVIADIAMILLGLFSGLDSTKSRWVPFTASCLCLAFIIFKLFIQGSRSAKLIGPKTSNLFHKITIFSMIIWTGYPIVFLLSYLPHGHPVLTPDYEVLLYAIHDVLAKPVFGLWLLYTYVSFGDSESGALLPESWTEPIGSQYGAVQITGDE